MRDVVVVLFTMSSAFAALARPWLGALALAVFAYLNPHRFAWGFSVNMPVYLIVFAATGLGLILHGEERQPFPWTWETVIFLSLLSWYTLTTFWVPDFPAAARDQWLKVMKIYLGIFPTFWLINSRERMRWMVIVIALSFGLIGLKGGIFALATGFSYRVWGPDNTFYGGNNEIALALNMMLPFLILGASEAESRKVRNFFYATLFFSVCSIISSWSRGGLLTLCAVGAMLLFVSKRRWLLVPVFALAIIVALPNLPQEWFDRMHSISTYDQDASVQGRFTSWKYAVDRALKNPLTGGGFETFRNTKHDSHSAYFQILGHHGFVALALWIFLLLGTLFALERVRRESTVLEDTKWMPPYARAIQMSLLAYAIGGAFLGVAYWDLFYHLIALSVLLKVMLKRSRQNILDRAEFGQSDASVGEKVLARV